MRHLLEINLIIAFARKQFKPSLFLPIFYYFQILLRLFMLPFLQRLAKLQCHKIIYQQKNC